MGQHVTLTTKDGKALGAYVARPAGAPRGGVVVIQEIFGVNPHIRSVADQYAAAGYLAIAPALFDPVEPGVELGYDAAGIEKGLELVGRLGFDAAIAGVEAAAAFIASAGKVGAVGYCWGGTVAYLGATRLGLPAVSYYGGRNVQVAGEKARAPLMFHYALKDAHISAEDRSVVEQANPDAAFYVYDADHGFNCNVRGSYHAPSAALAFDRSLDFFGRNLG